MKYKLIVIFLAMLLLFPLVNAEVETLGTFKVKECVNLKQTCGSCTYIKITSVLSPNSAILLAPVSMTTTDNIEWTYKFCDTNELGQYIVNGYGDVGGTDTVWAYDFEITSTGKSSGNTIPLFLGIASFLILFIALYYKTGYIGLFSGMLFIVNGVYMMIYGLGMFSDTWTRAIAYTSLAIGFMLSFASIYEIFQED